MTNITTDPLHFRSVCKLRKATISFIMSVCPSVYPNGATRLPLGGFTLNLIFHLFRKSGQKIPFSLKNEKKTGTLREGPYTFFDRISFSFSYSEKRFRRKVLEKPKQTFYLDKGWPTRWHLLYYILLNTVQPTLRYHITNRQSRYITPTRLKSAYTTQQVLASSWRWTY